MVNTLTDPNTERICLPPYALEPCDLLVSTTLAPSSGVIRVATNSPVSHTAMFLGDEGVIEAITPEVKIHSLEDALKDDSLSVVLRYQGLSDVQKEKIITFAKEKEGESYDYSGAAGAGIHANRNVCLALGSSMSFLASIYCLIASVGVLDRSDAFYCSELILEAYEHAGVPLGLVEPNTSNPNDLITTLSDQFEYIGDLSVPTS